MASDFVREAGGEFRFMLPFDTDEEVSVMRRKWPYRDSTDTATVGIGVSRSWKTIPASRQVYNT